MSALVTDRIRVQKLAGLLAASMLLACGPSAGGGGRGGGDGGGGGPDGNGDGGGGGTGLGDAAACATSSTKAQAVPLDMYVMLDQSGSMKQSGKWTNVTTALKAFVQQPNLSGFSVGIQYFGLNNDSCTASDYATPDVEIAPLPGVANALVASINAHSPTSGTPTSAALQGAIDHAKAWAQAHAQDVVINVFATDGDPAQCDTSLPDIDAIAAAGASGTPKILTFVIGVGSSLGNLNGIAAAGGTGQAFIVDTSGNINQQFLDALNMIRGTALGCQYAIPVPASGTPDFTKVNVQYTPGNGGPAVIIPNVTDKAACPATGNAWYYDSNAHPTQIVLCAPTCSTVSADAKGEVDVLLGCSIVVN